ncbi:MAG: trehalase [Bacteroidetes bacterium]|nr:MAG: trehalase [Bacteroidota bacterium]
MFSDQGAWFAYGLPKTEKNLIGFSGPFLMTQQNGIWSDIIMSRLGLSEGTHNSKIISFKDDLKIQKSYSSHLEQVLENDKLQINIELVFLNGNTVLQRFSIKNKTKFPLELKTSIQGGTYQALGIKLLKDENQIKLISENTNAIGYIKINEEFENIEILDEDSFYTFHKSKNLKPIETKSFVISQTFIFPEYSWEQEKALIERVDFDSVLQARKQEKNNQLKSLITNRKPQFQDAKYAEVLAKSQLTLQNNWRIPAGEIGHEGLFPSYHYEWFNGFWSWDSWKHAVGLSYYDLRLAKEQVKLMFEFQNDDGFVADCVYRDTTIEAHNYRDTKPPLSAWAVAKIYEKDKDLEFVKYMYPKLKKYHYWWYNKRDHDQDSLCEYGSTDGSLIAAKWESGMDNAIRFDTSKILKNSIGAYSLDQESVDLNAYLYAEKLFLLRLAEALNLDDVSQYKTEAEILKTKIQTQFYDENDGWFYDTNLEGTEYIKGEGSEGWTALWANAATQDQAEAVKNKMMDPNKFYTKVPFQTMSADHEKFDPLKGYWRGPNWLDQAYFGVKGLRNYGFNKEADKATIQILEGAKGLLGKGKSIKENYHPLTGEGLHAQNFSWSAAHVIMLLMNETND